MRDVNLVILGFMGTGKSTVARLVAGRLRRTFVDMDEEIEKKADKPITRIFHEDGEPAFRLLERDIAKELAARNNLVIAGGGGVILNPDNLKDLGATGFFVCLTAHEDEIIRRVSSGKKRPLLEDGDKEEKIRALLKARRAFYERIPNQLDTTRLSPHDAAAAVVRIFEKSFPV